MTPIVFLHVPKTAGQTVHNELVRAVGGAEYVSPVRVEEQALDGRHMPEGYRLYSGHIDWTELGQLPKDRFVFTILRDPRERIASFYLYMRKLAAETAPDALQKPENRGKRMALEMTADDYFFGGQPEWAQFVRRMYDNFYCSYFATRRMNGWTELQALPPEKRVLHAKDGLRSLSAVYSIHQLGRLEADIASRYGVRIHLVGNYFNTGGHKKNTARWPKLCAQFEKDRSLRQIESFVHLDDMLMNEVFPADTLSVVQDVAVVSP